MVIHKTHISFYRFARRLGDRQILRLCLGLLPLLMSLILTSAGQAQLANTKIAFTSTRDGNEELYMMNSDGTNPIRLTNNSANDHIPSWSPDGTKIAFASFRDDPSHAEIYVMNADGTGQTRLTHNSIDDDTPVWSPDGSQIAFSYAESGGWQVYVMNADGSNRTNLSRQPGSNNSQPTWSPNGTRIAFGSGRDGNPEIYMMNSDGTNQTRITNNSSDDQYPSWSPDGTKIAFISNRDGNYEIYVMDADGTNQTRLTNNLAADYEPSWSPDGTKITFRSNRDGNFEIYTMNADGTNQTRLTNNAADDAYPSWSPFLIPVLPSPDEPLVVSETYDGLSPGTPLPNWTSGVFAQRDTIPPGGGTGAAQITRNIPSAYRDFSLLRGIVTIDVWMKPKKGSDTNHGLHIGNHLAGKNDGGDYINDVVILHKNDQDKWWYASQTGPVPFADYDGNWHSFRVVYDTGRNVYSLYMDGVLIRADIPSPIDLSAGISHVGMNSGRFGDTTSYFDELKVYGVVALVPDIIISPPSHNYGNVTVGATADQPFTVSNPGTAPLNVTSVSLTGTDATQFSIQSGGGSFSLNPDQTHQVVVRFSPTSPGSKSATLSLANNVSGKNPFNVSLSGTGTQPPLFQVSPSPINMGIVNKGSSGIATFTVTNSGGGTLAVSNLMSSNPQFTASPTSFNLTAGASQTVTVTFRPTVVGWERSTLTITHNATGSPGTVTANGIGRVNPPIGSLANTKIAFASDRNGNWEIYTMNTDGTNQTRLTNNPAVDYTPSWSPDGTKIAFASDRDGNEEIYIMNAGGTNQIRLTNNPARDYQPSWSPDSTKIAFYSNRDGNGEVYVMNANGTNQIRLTNNPAYEEWPSWSPDSTKIVFRSGRDGNGEIYVMNADGTNQVNLTNNPANDVTPSWSSDGTKIAFYSERDNPNEIYIMNADGTNQTKLPNNTSGEYQLTWSPDGTKIVFGSSDRELYVVNADGTNQTKLTNTNPAYNDHPSWSQFLPPSANPPVANPPPNVKTMAEDTAVGITLTGSDSDGDNLTFAIGTGPSHGTLSNLTQQPNSGTNDTAIVTYTPNANYYGPDSFTFTVADALATSTPATVTITVNPVADTPSITDATTTEDTQTSSGLVISRNPNDGAEVTHFKITNVTNGTLFQSDGLTPINNGAFISFVQGGAGLKFTPLANFSGVASFVVQASLSNADSGLGGAPVTARITVTPVNDAPVFDPIADMTVPPVVPVTITGVSPGGGADEAGQTVILTATSENTSVVPNPITITGSGATRTLTFTLAANANGTAPIRVTATDNGPTGAPHVNTSSQTFKITVTQKPALSIDDVTVIEGNSGTVNATFTVTLSVASNEIVTVNYATADGTAIADSDYVAASGLLTFDPGDTKKTLTVQVKGDTNLEGDETFFVNLSDATNATIVDGQGKGTITNDPTSTPPLWVKAPETAKPGERLDIEIRAGEENNPVTNLFGVSFRLLISHPNLLSVKEVTRGDFLGTDALFFPNPEAGVVSVGITRKGGTGGVSGSGTIAHIIVDVSNTVANDQDVTLTLTEVTANNPSGQQIVLTPKSATIRIIVTPPPPVSLAMTIAGTVFEGDALQIAITTLDANGNPVTSATAVTVNLSSSSLTGRFDTTATGTFNSSVISVTVAASSASATAFYKDTKAGPATLTASATGLTSATHPVTVNSAITSVTVNGSPVKAGGTVTVTAIGKPNATASFSIGNIVTDKAMTESAAGTYTGTFSPIVDVHADGTYDVVVKIGSSSLTKTGGVVILHGDQIDTNILVVDGVIRNPDGSPAEAGLSVTVTVGGNLSQTVTSTNNGNYTATFLDLLAIVAKIGDTVTVSVSRVTTGESAVSTVVLTPQQILEQKVTIDVRCSGKSQFDLSFPKGIGLVHIPLKVTAVGAQAVTLKTIGDLYDALGGSANVNFIITRDAAAGVWLSYLGERSRGTAANRTLTDDLGIIPVMINPVTLRLKDDALGVDGKAQIHLQKGTNLVGVPLKDARLKKVSDLFSLAGIKDNATSIIVSDNGTFKVVAQPGDDGDIAITGGQSFIVIARAGGTAEIRGVAWNNVSGNVAAPSIAFGHIDESTPVLAVHGAVVDEVTGLAKESFRVTVKNLSTGVSLSTLSGSGTAEGGYNVTFVDAISSRAARIGDTLAIAVETPNPLIAVQPLRHTVSTDDVNNSYIRLANLIAYHIPTETKLLPNYPNPFNPETWIPYQLSKPSHVSIIIYDALGRVVKRLDLGYQPAGLYQTRTRAVHWDGRNEVGEPVASGVYFVQLKAEGYQQTRRIVLLK
ncbi:PD40 domain-containing protein [Candidatus Poribacteria bacterium]|nr:PD40 domain-containing protein [Candidatus Poribacteria bacterium]